VKKVLVIAVLTLGTLLIACDKQKALDRILADPQMKSYILTEVMKSEQTRAQLADSIFADKTMTDRYLNQLVANEYARSDLFSRILKADPTGNWIISKLAEDPNLKSAMRQASK
jgi:hypothetical protein